MLRKANFLKSIRTLFIKEKIFENKYVTISDTSYFVRKIIPEDIKDLLAIEREVYAGELPWSKSAFLMELKSPVPHLYILIKRKQKTIGFVGCRVFGKNTHITNIAVSTHYQGKGVASYMIKEIKKFAHENKSNILSLEVRINNKKAQRVYRKSGFVATAIKTGYYADNGEDALEMILNLTDE